MQDKILFALMCTQAAHAELARKKFDELGLTEGQPKVLYILRVMEGCTQKELAAVCKIKESTLTVHLKKLGRMGFIKKSQIYVSGGKSAKAIHLTKEGKEMAERIFEVVEELEVKSLQGFSKEEREMLFQMLHRVEKNLS